jgi:hypothetical protein
MDGNDEVVSAGQPSTKITQELENVSGSLERDSSFF